MHCEEAERAVECDVDGRDPVAVWRWCAGAGHVERSDSGRSEAFGEVRVSTSCAPRETYSGTGLSSGRCDVSGSVNKRSPNMSLCVSRSWRVRISKTVSSNATGPPECWNPRDGLSIRAHRRRGRRPGGPGPRLTVHAAR